MFIKLTRSGGHTYAQLVEVLPRRTRQTPPAHSGHRRARGWLGGLISTLLGGLLRAKGRSLGDSAAPQVRFESALALGDVWALDQLWHELGFDGLSAVFRRARLPHPSNTPCR